MPTVGARSASRTALCTPRFAEAAGRIRLASQAAVVDRRAVDIAGARARNTRVFRSLTTQVKAD